MTPSSKIEKLVIPEKVDNELSAFHKGELEDLTQYEVDKIAEYIRFVKAQRK